MVKRFGWETDACFPTHRSDRMARQQFENPRTQSRGEPSPTSVSVAI
jgi:hypothetical protein